MEKIQMKHIDPGKKTIAMDKDKYETLKRLLISYLEEKEEATFKEILSGVTDGLNSQGTKFSGSVQWHLAWVQMDMEARNELIKNTGASPQRFSLRANSL